MNVLSILVLLSALHYYGQSVAMKVLLPNPEAWDAATPNAVNAAMVNHGVYDVTSYGAKCDGSTDDTAAIQAAITAASGAGTIILPAATCVVSPPTTGYILNLGGGNITVRGVGMGVSVLKVRASAGDYKAVFGPYQGTFSNVTLADFTINQNTTNNPVTSSIMTYPRMVINSASGGNNLTVSNLEVLDIGSVNAISAGTARSVITHSRFVLNTTGNIYHDHSTLYISAEHSTVDHNLFVGGINAAGSVCAIETHAGTMTITGNVVDGFWLGGNITGVSSIGDSNAISVSGNTVINAYSGFQLWSNTLRTHTSGFGLRGVTLESNIIRLTQNSWTVNPVSGKAQTGNPSGIFITPGANLPVSNILIANNAIEYDLSTSGSDPFNTSGMGIGYWDALGTNRASDFRILGNTIINSPIYGIRMSVAGSDFEISGNHIINPGSSANRGLAAANRVGIFIASSSSAPLADVRVNNNVIVDNLPTSRIVRGIYLATPAGSDISARGNQFDVSGATTTSYLFPLDVNTNTQTPFVEFVNIAPAITSNMWPSGKVALNSIIYDVPSGKALHVKQDGLNWQSTQYSNAAPVSGAYSPGDIVWNTNPGAPGVAGWVNTARGSPGRWAPIPLLGDDASAELNKVYRGQTGALTFGAIPSQMCAERSAPIHGIVTGNPSQATPSASLGNVNLSWSSWISDNGTLTVRVCNPSAASITPVPVAWNYRVDR